MKENTVLLMCPLYPPTQQRLEETYPVHRLWEAADEEALIAKLAPTLQVVVTSGGRGIDAATLAKLPGVKLVSCFGVGVDAIDTAYCASHGIAVTNTPDVLTDDVADLAVALMITSLRRIAEADRFVRAGQWLKGSLPLGTAVAGRKVGIIGMGRIGQAIAERCAAFKTELAYHGPRPKPVDYRYFPDLVALATWADVLIAACPGGAATRGLVSGKVLEALGPQGLFVNIARGSVVEEEAMVRLLVERKLGGAALDVFQDEPNVPAALLTLDSVVLQPHQGSGTSQTRQAMGDLTVDNVDAYFAGKPLVTPYKA
ncbi:MAG: 2-hydroxyacid dehydrogenase [Burkholderiaceae bacterium]|nr:2-hydroxyacid dehydrogenase [Burkholderiaceae bacterium]